MNRLALGALALVALGALGGCATTGLRARGVEPTRTTEQALAEALMPRRVAVLVGVNDYDDPALPGLRYAEADAEALGELLEAPTGGGFDDVIVVPKERTTREGILAALRGSVVGQRAEDTYVVYFGGHGTMTLEDDEPRLFLLPTDATPGALSTTGLDLVALQDWFSGLPAIRKALILDACFDGRGRSVVAPELAAEAPRLAAASPRMRLSELSSGEAHLYASSPGRPSYEDDTLGRGVYSWFLTQALSWARPQADLDGDGAVTVFEAHDWARGRTMAHTGGVQVPEAALRVVGRNDVVLVGEAKALEERDQALVFDYRVGEDTRYAGASLVIDGRTRGIFPGTVAVAPGLHHLEVRDSDGGLLVDGYARVDAGESLRVQDLPVLVREDRALFSMRSAALLSPSPGLRSVWGPGAIGFEAQGLLRKARGPARGILLSTRLGAGLAPRRLADGDVLTQARPTFWGAAGLGWGGGPRRLRVRASWDVQLTGLPMQRAADAVVTKPHEAGWLLFSTGPSATVGVALDRRFSLVLGLSGQLTPLQLDDADGVRPYGFVLGSAGVEVAL